MRTRIPALLASAGVTVTLFAATAGTAQAASAQFVGCGSAGKVTAKMCRLYKAASSASSKGHYHWDSQGCKHSDPLPYPPQGRACDLVYGKIGRTARGDNRADGNKMVRWLVSHHG